jgi:putative DNA primase/helicase
VEGCLKWQKEGLGVPEAIKQATDGYREEMDILGPFLQEKCIVHTLAKVEAKEIYDEYKTWCFSNGEIELKNRAFYRQLETRGFKKFRGNLNKNYFSGIGLIKGNPDLRNEKVTLSNKNNISSINKKLL